MISNIQFTDNFSLYELLLTSHRRFDEEQYNPPVEIVENLRALVVNILQPLRDAMGTAISINSGYRCPSLNRSIGGARNSQHMTGQAADSVASDRRGVDISHRAKLIKKEFSLQYIICQN
jgi:uncharacterized protein YcbK (DUF882 family)